MNVCKKLTLTGHLPFARTGSAELCAVSGKTDPALEEITQYGYKELSLKHWVILGPPVPTNGKCPLTAGGLKF